MKKQRDYKDYLEGTRQILEDSKSEKEPYEVVVVGKKFIVYPNVFSPKYFKDTEIFTEQLPVAEGEEILEIGPGTGVISITAALKGAKKVVAAEINPVAVRNTQANIELHGLQERVEVRESDVYSAVKADEKFDTIFWNTPFGLVKNEKLTDLEKSVYDLGYEATERFVKEAHRYLKPGGRLLIGFSSTLGKLDLVKKFANEAGFNIKLLSSTDSDEVHPVKFEIFEARLS